jgi:hypothetical protein
MMTVRPGRLPELIASTIIRHNIKINYLVWECIEQCLHVLHLKDMVPCNEVNRYRLRIFVLPLHQHPQLLPVSAISVSQWIL